jgi:hypothetical protein
MITVLALTQFVFLTLGTIFFKGGMVNANGELRRHSTFSFSIKIGYGFFCFLSLGLPTL